MATCAITGGDGEIAVVANALRFPPFHMDVSDDEDEVGAWIWKTGRIARLVGSSGATNIWEILLSSLEYLFSGGADNQGASYRP